MIQRTFKLSDKWDLTLDKNGQIALSKGTHAVAQTIANRCRLFVRDAAFAFNEGIPYFDIALGHEMQAALLANELRRTALEVDGVVRVVEVTVEDFDLENRVVKARIEVITEDSQNVVIDL